MEMWRKAQLVLTQTHKVIHSAAVYHLLYIGDSFTAVGCVRTRRFPAADFYIVYQAVTGPFELILILNTRRCFIQLPRKEYPSQFKAQLKGKKRTDLIEYLDGIRARLNQIATTFLMEGQPLTADALKAYFQNGGYVVYTVKNLFDDYMENPH